MPSVELWLAATGWCCEGREWEAECGGGGLGGSEDGDGKALIDEGLVADPWAASDWGIKPAVSELGEGSCGLDVRSATS